MTTMRTARASCKTDHVDRVTSPPSDDDPESFAAWRRFLDYLHTTLEAHAKDTRSTMAGQLLRFLDHRATDKTRGCWLGHMTARTLAEEVDPPPWQGSPASEDMLSHFRAMAGSHLSHR